MNEKIKLRGRVGRPLAGLMTLMLAGFLGSPSVHAQENDDASRIQRGFEIAPVPLNLKGLDRELVGLGSYIVNATADCNGCHTGGGPPNFDYAAGFNPYFSQPKKVDPTTYLAGGQDFGPVGPPDNPGPDIISRNLTPDKTGLPEGGHTLADFIRIIRTGYDFDHLHPTCTATSPAPTPPNCIPAPVDGSLLQIMPWPTFQNMSDHELEAIYEYLRAIPCIEGPTDPTDPLHNDCGTPSSPSSSPTGITIAVTGPGGAAGTSFTTFSSEITVDASLTTSSNPGALTYSWAVSPGFPNVAIEHNNTATPTFQLSFHGTYQFTLTVTDAAGLKATTTITVQFA